MKKVLVVDDDAWLADSYRVLLESHGWQVTITGSAQDAIKLIDDVSPHVVLLDYMLPFQSAPALLHELQSYSDTQHIPVLLCTTLSLPHASELKDYGVHTVIDKAKVTPKEIVEAIEKAYAAA